MLAAAGVAFIVVALDRSLDGRFDELVPTWPRLIVSLAFVLVAQVAGALSWRALFGPAGRARGLTKGFFLATLARYVPGGIWQPIGQVGSAAHAGIPMSTAVIAFPVHVVIYVVSSAAIGSGIAYVVPGLPLVVRVLAAAGVLSLVLLRRGWMAWTISFARRYVRRLPEPERLPDQGSILRSFGYNLVCVAATCAAFAVLARSGAALFAFSAAWAAGFVVFPVPSGLGIREAVLVGLLPQRTSVVLSAAIVVRAVQALGELMIAATAAIDGVVRRKDGTSPVSPPTVARPS